MQLKLLLAMILMISSSITCLILFLLAQTGFQEVSHPQHGNLAPPPFPTTSPLELYSTVSRPVPRSTTARTPTRAEAGETGTRPSSYKAKPNETWDVPPVLLNIVRPADFQVRTLSTPFRFTPCYVEATCWLLNQPIPYQSDSRHHVLSKPRTFYTTYFLSLPEPTPAVSRTGFAYEKKNTTPAPVPLLQASASGTSYSTMRS